jgi:hypothetical protein
MVDYAMVPTCGLPHTEASAIAGFLTKAATTGQTQGEAPGQLGLGYYPLTSKQRAQTLSAAKAVETQDCTSPPPDNTVGGTTTSTTTNTGSTRTPSATHSPESSPGTSGTTPTTRAGLQAFGQKSPDSGIAGLLVLLATILGALLLVGGSAAWAVTATGRWPAALRWLRPVVTRLTAARTWLTGLLPTGRA